MVPADASLATAKRARVQATREVRLGLLGAFDLTIGGARVLLPMNAQRVLVFLALHGGSLLRPFVAGSLWLDSTDEKAAGSLRSAVWRLNRGRRLVDTRGDQLRLVADLTVDVDAAVAQAQRLLDPANLDAPRPSEVLLCHDLLPDWYDDWVTVERERLRQLRAHALEQLSQRLVDLERFGEAIEAGLAVARTEPLRESAHRMLIRIHLAEGNLVEALDHYHRFEKLLHDELGLAPSPRMTALVANLTRR